MTITTGAMINEFSAQVDLASSSAAVANGAFSVAGDLNVLTLTDDVRELELVLQGDFAAAVDANSSVNVYFRSLNIEGTNDQEIPDANFQQDYVGSFALNDVATAQYKRLIVTPPTGKSGDEFELYIENVSGQSLDAAWTIFYKEKTINTKA